MVCGGGDVVGVGVCGCVPGGCGVGPGAVHVVGVGGCVAAGCGDVVAGVEAGAAGAFGGACVADEVAGHAVAADSVAGVVAVVVEGGEDELVADAVGDGAADAADGVGGGHLDVGVGVFWTLGAAGRVGDEYVFGDVVDVVGVVVLDGGCLGEVDDVGALAVAGEDELWWVCWAGVVDGVECLGELLLADGCGGVEVVEGGEDATFVFDRVCWVDEGGYFCSVEACVCAWGVEAAGEEASAGEGCEIVGGVGGDGGAVGEEVVALLLVGELVGLWALWFFGGASDEEQ